MANKYPTMPRAGTQGATRSGQSRDGFMGPPPAVVSPPPPPTIPAAAAAAGGAAASAALAVGLGIGLGAAFGYWASGPARRWGPVKPKPWRSFSANPDAWDPSQTTPWLPPGYYAGWDPAHRVDTSKWLVHYCKGGTPEKIQSAACGSLGAPACCYPGTGHQAAILTTTWNTLPTWADLTVGTQSSYKMFYPEGTVSGGSTVVWHVGNLYRKTGVSSPTPFFFPKSFAPPAYPTIPPWDSPEALPIHKPAGPPRPKPSAPGRAPRPREPYPQPEPEPQTRPRPGTWAWPGEFPQPHWPPFFEVPPYVPLMPPDVHVQPKPGTQPGTGPGTQPGPGPGPGPSPGPGPGSSPAPSAGSGLARGRGGDISLHPPSYQDAPPREREKERKIRLRSLSLLGAVGGKARIVINAATEWLDFIDAAYKGVPKDIRRHHHCANHDYACKISALWDAWDRPDYDAGKFVTAFLNNQFEDYLYGRLGSQIAKVNRNLNIETGINRLLTSGQDSLGKVKGAPDYGPLPEIQLSEDGFSFHWQAAGW